MDLLNHSVYYFESNVFFLIYKHNVILKIEKGLVNFPYCFNLFHKVYVRALVMLFGLFPIVIEETRAYESIPLWR